MLNSIFPKEKYIFKYYRTLKLTSNFHKLSSDGKNNAKSVNVANYYNDIDKLIRRKQIRCIPIVKLIRKLGVIKIDKIINSNDT